MKQNRGFGPVAGRFPVDVRFVLRRPTGDMFAIHHGSRFGGSHRFFLARHLTPGGAYGNLSGDGHCL